MNKFSRLRLAQKKHDAAQIAYDNEHYQQAAELYLESAELIKNLREEELGYATCLVNAANALNELGNHSQAKKIIEIALPIQKKILGLVHPSVATSLNSLAITYRKLGEYEKAKELHEGSLAIRKKTVPSNHPEIADILAELADTYGESGEYEKAKKLHENSLAIREKILPSNHPDIARSLNDLAIIYEKQGDIENAEKSYQRAKKILNENHPLFKIISENYLELKQEIEELRKKEIEQRIALEEAKKLSYLGYMATGIAHNINNPVGIVQLAAQRGLRKLEKGISFEEGNEIFQRILNQANRLHEIIQNFRKFANGDRKHRENISLNEVVKAIQGYFENQLESHNIKLVFDLSDKNPQSYANDFILQEVLTNLISNARDALENISDATIWVKTWEQKNKVGFIVEDNGNGISEEQQKNLFSPFHSTKAHGTGLGLYFAYQSLNDLQGTITYQDRKPNGAHFLIELPSQMEQTHD